MKEVIGFKVVDHELNYQSGLHFEVGKTYKWDKTIAEEHYDDPCNRQEGLCFTTKAVNTLNYLPYDRMEGCRFLMVKAYGYKKLMTLDNDYCTKKMKVLRELTFPELLFYFDEGDMRSEVLSELMYKCLEYNRMMSSKNMKK